MPYIAPEVITEAKRMDLLTYLREYEPGELVKFSSNTYTTRTHDSLKISNGKWMWWSRGIGGKSALDYLIKVRGMDFVQAVQTIMGNGSVSFPTCKNIKSYEEQPLLLPQKSPTTIKHSSISVLSIDPEELPEESYGETNYELLSDEDFEVNKNLF